MEISGLVSDKSGTRGREQNKIENDKRFIGFEKRYKDKLTIERDHCLDLDIKRLLAPSSLLHQISLIDLNLNINIINYT